MSEAKFQIYRGDKEGGAHKEYSVEVTEGMVVLDAVHKIQATKATDLACRWNCKAGKCGSCSAEINGRPRLMCMTRMNTFKEGETIKITPLKAFPIIKDLVTDVSWNYEVNKKIPPFKPKAPEADGTWRMEQIEVDRVQEFRKCIECFLCQDVCHVVRNQDKKAVFGGPRFLVRAASLEMHPLDTVDRTELMKDELGIGYCNITKCCTEVCPEGIKITDNAIIPMKERVADTFYDPLIALGRKIFGSKSAVVPGLLIALLLASGCRAKENPPVPVAPAAAAAAPAANPKLAPDFTLPEVGSGDAIKLSSYRGKVVLIDFWATWCGPCRMEIPHFVELQKKYKGQGFAIIGISLDQQGEEVVKPFMKQWKINYSMVIDSSGEVQGSYGGVRAIPTSLLIGKDGEVKQQFIGYRPKEVFEEAIKKALQEG